jgi:hypothetical protein
MAIARCNGAAGADRSTCRERTRKVWLLDIASGQRRLFRQLPEPPPGPAKGWLFNAFITSDGQYSVGTYQNWLADLFVLDGVK